MDDEPVHEALSFLWMSMVVVFALFISAITLGLFYRSPSIPSFEKADASLVAGFAVVAIIASIGFWGFVIRPLRTLFSCSRHSSHPWRGLGVLAKKSLFSAVLFSFPCSFLVLFRHSELDSIVLLNAIDTLLFFAALFILKAIYQGLAVEKALKAYLGKL